MCLYLDLNHRSHTGAAPFTEINSFPFSERVESCIATSISKYWTGIVESYINKFKLSYDRHNTRSQTALDMTLRKTNTRKQALSPLGPKIWTKIGHNYKNVKTTASLHMFLREKF